MSEHLSDWQFNAMIEERLSAEEAERVERHLETCEFCLQRLSTLNDAELRAIDPRSVEGGERHPDYNSQLVRRIAHAIDASPAEPPVDEAQVTTKLKFARFVDRGGLGQVFEYTDCEFQRRVAIKLLRAELAGNPAIVARFRREMEITATIDTPGCPAVYGSGRTPDGHLFYWMQLVTGPTLSQEIAAFHASPHDLSRSSATFRRLLELFRGVCNTLAIAHERGILHRDLKPDNIRVHRDGHPIVLDWGLAKAQGRQDESPLEETEAGPLLSRSGMKFGTPEYMAPEQAIGDVARVSRSADIYGLGGILHEILAGKPPHEQLRRMHSTNDALLNAVARGHLPALPDVPRELASIIHRALAINPDERYSDARELAAEIDRWLAGQPVVAHRYRVVERCALEVRRRPLSFLAAAATLLVVVVATVVSLRYQMRAKIEQVEAAQQRAIAGRRFDVALQAQNALVTAVQEELGEFANTSPARRLLLKRAKEGLEELLREAENQPGAELAVLQTRYELAYLQQYYEADFTSANKEYRRLQVELEQLAGVDERDRRLRRKLLADVLGKLFLTEQRLNREGAAKPIAETYLKYASDTAQEFPGDELAIKTLANAHYLLGQVEEHDNADPLTKALRHYEISKSTIEMLPELARRKPSNITDRLTFISAIADIKSRQKLHDEAIATQSEIVDQMQDLATASPTVKNRVNLVEDQLQLATLYKRARRMRECIEHYDATTAAVSRLIEEYPDALRLQSIKKDAQYNLAVSYRDSGDLDKALPLLRELCVPLAELDLQGGDSASLDDQASNHASLSNTLFMAKRPMEASKCMQDAVAIRRVLFKRFPTDVDNTEALLDATGKWLVRAPDKFAAELALKAAREILAELDDGDKALTHPQRILAAMSYIYNESSKQAARFSNLEDPDTLARLRDGHARAKTFAVAAGGVSPAFLAEVEKHIAKYDRLLNRQ